MSFNPFLPRDDHTTDRKIQMLKQSQVTQSAVVQIQQMLLLIFNWLPWPFTVCTSDNGCYLTSS